MIAIGAAAKLYAISPLSAMAPGSTQQSVQRLASKALATCRGMVPGATSITSKRMSRSIVVGVMGKPEFGRGDDAALASLGHRLGGVIDAFARLDLDEHQRAATARHDIDLAERGFPTPRHDAIALGDQQHGGAAFRGKPEPKSRHALLARRPRRLQRFSATRHGSASSPASLARVSAR